MSWKRSSTPRRTSDPLMSAIAYFETKGDKTQITGGDTPSLLSAFFVLS
jgi:hypothetical protein